jgi:hypothetical protein
LLSKAKIFRYAIIAWGIHITEARKTGTKIKIAVLILLDIMIVAGVWQYIESQRAPTALVNVIEFTQERYYLPTTGVSVEVKVYNSGSAKAYNVTLVIVIYGTSGSHQTRVFLKAEEMWLGAVNPDSQAQFRSDIPYPSVIQFDSTVEPVAKAWASIGELTWDNPSSGFRIDALWLVTLGSATAVFLLFLNVYSAWKLGVFMWLREKRKAITITLMWSLAVAVVVIKSYWLAYVENPVLFENRIVWTSTINWMPRLTILDLILILIISLIAGALLIDLETIIYSLVANYALSFAFAVAYSTLFIWFTLGYGETFADAGGFLEMGPVVIYVAVRNIFRLIFPLAQIFCLLGAIIGAFIRGYLQPSAGQYV